jgi:hypothetical protein
MESWFHFDLSYGGTALSKQLGLVWIDIQIEHRFIPFDLR